MVIVNWSPFNYNSTFEVAIEDIMGKEIGEDEVLVVRDLWLHKEVGRVQRGQNKF